MPIVPNNLDRFLGWGMGPLNSPFWKMGFKHHPGDGVPVIYGGKSIQGCNQLGKNKVHYMTPTQTMHY